MGEVTVKETDATNAENEDNNGKLQINRDFRILGTRARRKNTEIFKKLLCQNFI